jgi:hypothetical protein
MVARMVEDDYREGRAHLTDRIILLADRRGGKPLGGKEGPWRVIVPDERHHAQWVRQVITLRVRRS